MPYEPKYKLNQKDSARWHELLTRHCLECPAKPGGKVKRHKKYPPLSLAENAEFEALCAKRSAKLSAHPRMRAALRYQRRRDKKVEALLTKLEALLAPVREKLNQIRKTNEHKKGR